MAFKFRSRSLLDQTWMYLVSNLNPYLNYSLVRLCFFYNGVCDKLFSFCQIQHSSLCFMSNSFHSNKKRGFTVRTEFVRIYVWFWLIRFRKIFWSKKKSSVRKSSLQCRCSSQKKNFESDLFSPKTAKTADETKLCYCNSFCKCIHEQKRNKL